MLDLPDVPPCVHFSEHLLWRGRCTICQAPCIYCIKKEKKLLFYFILFIFFAACPNCIWHNFVVCGAVV